MFVVTPVDFETCKVESQLYCEAYGAGAYHLNRFYECFNGGLTEKEFEIEKKTCSFI